MFLNVSAWFDPSGRPETTMAKIPVLQQVFDGVERRIERRTAAVLTQDLPAGADSLRHIIGIETGMAVFFNLRHKIPPICDFSVRLMC